MNPHYPGWYAGVLGFALRLSGQYDEAISSFTEYGEKVVGFGHVDLVIVHAETGNSQRARDEALNVLKYRPQFTVSGWAETQLFSDLARLERDRAALLSAGLPE